MRPQRISAQSPSRKLAIIWLVIWLLPPLCAFVVQWLPILNGPHLFLGIPAIMWWTCSICCFAVSPVLLIIERTRTDRDLEDRLDQEAIRAGDELARQQAQTAADGRSRS